LAERQVPIKTIGIYAEGLFGITNVPHQVTHNLFDINLGGGGYFAGDVDHVPGAQGFDGTP
jgi:hypothetical protein